MDTVRATETEWDAFAQSQGAWAHQSWNWTRVWMEHYLGAREARIFEFRCGDRIVAILPLVIDSVRIGPIKVRLAKPALADFTLALCDPCVDPEFADQVFTRVLEILFEEERCDAYATGPLTSRTDALDRLFAIADGMDGATHLDKDVAPQTTFDLPETFDEYMASLAKRQRGNVRRDMNLLSRNFSIESDVLNLEDELDGEIDPFLRLHEEQWNRVGKLGHFEDWPGATEFARDLITSEAQRGRARLYRLLADDEVIAYQLSFRYGDIMHWHMPARAADESWDRFGLGRVGLVRMIESAIGEGVRLLEGGRGRYEYKVKLGAEETMIRAGFFIRPGARSHRRAKLLIRWSHVLNQCYYRVWYSRVAPRLPFGGRGLWRGWVRTRL